MQVMKSKLIVLCGVFICTNAFCQSDFINRGDKQYQVIDRLSIQFPYDSLLNFGATKFYNRKTVTEGIEHIYSVSKEKVSKVDQYNIQSLLVNNSEWVTKPTIFFHPKEKALLYKTPAHFYSKSGKDFFIAVDPLLNIQTGRTSDGTGNLYTN